MAVISPKPARASRDSGGQSPGRWGRHRARACQRWETEDSAFMRGAAGHHPANPHAGARENIEDTTGTVSKHQVCPRRRAPATQQTRHRIRPQARRILAACPARLSRRRVRDRVRKIASWRSERSDRASYWFSTGATERPFAPGHSTRLNRPAKRRLAGVASWIRTGAVAGRQSNSGSRRAM